MSSKKKSLHQLNIAVFQNGVLISDYAWPIYKTGLISLSARVSSKAALSIPGYQGLKKNIKLLKVKKKNLRLFFDIPWLGQISHKDDILVAGGKKKKFLDIAHDDFGLLRYKDLTFAFNLIKPQRLQSHEADQFTDEYLTRFFALPDNSQNTYAWIFATLAAVTLIGSIFFGLMYRKTFRAQKFSDLKQELVLPFVDPKMIPLSPEALQLKYSRKNVLPQLVQFNMDLVGAYLGTSRSSDYLFPTTLQRFSLLNKNYKNSVNTFIENRLAQNETMTRRNKAALIFIPSVVGEGIEITIRRVMEKGLQVQEALKTNLVERQALTKSIREGEIYNLADYKSVVTESKSKFSKEQLEYLNKASAQSQQTLEERMYSELDKLAIVAKSRQLNLIKQNIPSPTPVMLATSDFSATFAFEGTPLNEEYIYAIEDRLLAFENTKQVIKEGKKLKTAQLSGDYLASLKKVFPQIQACYKKAVRRQPTTKGSMVWNWQIDLPGKPFNLALGLSEINNAGMEHCIEGALSQVVYRSSKDNLGKIFTHTFIFAPEK